MTTKMDEKVREVRDTIDKLYTDILSALEPSTWGFDEYHSDFIEKLEESLLKVSELKRLIK